MTQAPTQGVSPDNPPANNAKLSAKPFKLWQDIANPQEVRIEIVPMIDVIFCILTFFILAAVGFSRQQAISLNLPKASTGTPQMREMLVVSLDQEGQLYLERQPVTKVQLYSAVKNYHNLNPTGLMVLHASKEVTYNQVVELLDMLKEVGGDRVALATLSGESQIPSTTASPYPGLNPYYNPNSLPSYSDIPPNNNLPSPNSLGGGNGSSPALPPPLPGQN